MIRHKRLIVMIVISLVLVACSAENAWTTAPDMPTERWEHSPCVVDGKIYVIGGFISGDYHYKGLPTVEVYDPVTDAWTTAPDMPTGKYGAYTSVVDGKIYVFGGVTGWPASAYGMVEVYDPH
jgi:N-acetylneuraminic acid mutarotase